MQKLISIKDITRAYEGSDESSTVTALKGISLEINAGEFVTIMGRSGSGKSTLLHILGLLDLPNTGTYLLSGQPTQNLTGRKLAELRNQHFGFVFQSFNLLPRTTVFRNVELPLIYNRKTHADRAKKVRTVLEKVGLSHRIDHTSNQLSGGEQQRVAIARALVNDPDVIFADEPTGNLDTKTSDSIIALLDDLVKEGKTVVMVTHEDDLAQHGTHRIVLRDGSMITEERK